MQTSLIRLLSLIVCMLTFLSVGQSAQAITIDRNGNFATSAGPSLTPTDLKGNPAFGTGTLKPLTDTTCVGSWNTVKLKASFITLPPDWGLGQSDDPCIDGYLHGARAASSDWNYRNKVSVGSKESIAKKYAIGNCSKGKYKDRCGFNSYNGSDTPLKNGYVLASTNCEASGGRLATVVAVSSKKRVASLRIWHPICE